MNNGKSLDFSKFRDNMNSLLKARGMSQRKFAIDADISIPTVCRYMTGERSPDLPYIIQIADYFNVSIDWLLGRSMERGAYPTDLKEMVERYEIASDSDKLVIQTILKKYEKELH